jgi:hypothetical protein
MKSILFFPFLALLFQMPCTAQTSSYQSGWNLEYNVNYDTYSIQANNAGKGMLKHLKINQNGSLIFYYGRNYNEHGDVSLRLVIDKGANHDVYTYDQNSIEGSYLACGLGNLENKQRLIQECKAGSYLRVYIKNQLVGIPSLGPDYNGELIGVFSLKGFTKGYGQLQKH